MSPTRFTKAEREESRGALRLMTEMERDASEGAARMSYGGFACDEDGPYDW